MKVVKEKKIRAAGEMLLHRTYEDGTTTLGPVADQPEVNKKTREVIPHTAPVDEEDEDA